MKTSSRVCPSKLECPGALNIEHNLIIHEPDQGTHDTNLFRVLDRLRERSLTLNLRKCWFRRLRVEYYGLQLSGNGVQPTEVKVRAIVDTTSPASAVELRSSLGMVRFSARFLSDLSTTAEPFRQITHK